MKRFLLLKSKIKSEFFIKTEDDFKRMEEIKTKCSQMSNAWHGKRAKSIPVIPEKPVWSEFEQIGDVKDLQETDRFIPIAYDMNSADVFSIDLSKTFSWLISGRARTGKTNALKAIMRSASGKRGKVVVIEHGSSELKSLSTAVGATYIDNQADQAQFFSDLVEPFKERNIFKRTLLENGKDEQEIYNEMQSKEPYYIIISDIVPFVQSIQKPDPGVLQIGKFVENIAEKGKLHNVYFFVGINPETVGPVMGLKLYDHLISYHTGLHLGGMVSNVRYFDFSNFLYTEQSKTQKVGIGMLPTGDDEVTEKIVIPLVRG